MRNAQIAEWILSLVTSQERAGATVGDLMENAPSHARFWLGVLRTAVSLLWREFSEEPARMMGLAVKGVLLEIAILVVFMIGAAFAGGMLGGLLYLTGTAAGPHPVMNAVIWMLAYAFAGLLVPFQIGRWLARRSPGRELAPCVGFVIFDLAVWIPLGLIWGNAQSNGFQSISGLIISLTLTTVYTMPLFAGAAWVRRQRLSH